MTTPNIASTLTVVALAGSLRRGSFNRSLVLAAKELAPPRLTIEILSIADIPLYNQDLEAGDVPESVLRLRQQVEAADGLLIATPEYNHSVPGVLKNVIDWLSRPPERRALSGKPTAVMGASPGLLGTARAQDHLRQSLVFTDSPTLLQPEVLVSRAHEKFDANGRLTDDATRTFLAGFLFAFEQWITRFAPVTASLVDRSPQYNGLPVGG